MFGAIKRALARRSSVKSSDPFLAEYFGLKGSLGSVTPETTLSASSVAYRCVALRSELLASVPLQLYRHTEGGGREPANDHPLATALRVLANDNATAFEAREFLIRSHDLTGNGYARLEWNARGQVVALHPLDPRNVGVEILDSGRLRYRVSNPRGGVTVHTQEEILHIRGPSRDGFTGLSPLVLGARTLALAIDQAEGARNFIGNGMRPAGVLSFAEKVSQNVRDAHMARLQESYAGATNAGKLLIVDGGAKFEPLAFSPEASQALESRKLSNEDVARLFGVPPTAVGITDKATYANMEQEARALVTNALAPLAARIEAAIHRCCLTAAGRRTHFAQHDLDGLQRGDVESRFKAYRIAREIGAFSPNDVRRRENEPPIPNGDTYHMPVNWTPIDKPTPAPERTTP